MEYKKPLIVLKYLVLGCYGHVFYVGDSFVRLDGPSNPTIFDWSKKGSHSRIDGPTYFGEQIYNIPKQKPQFHVETLKLGPITQFIDIDCRLDILTLE